MTMSRRKAKPRLSPVWMPYLRGKLADYVKDVSHWQDERRANPSGAEYRNLLREAWDESQRIRTASMWWVSRDMATLAVHAALHEELPEVAAPSPSGFILFDGGLEFDGDPMAPHAHIVGLHWQTDYGSTVQYRIVLYTDTPRIIADSGLRLPLTPIQPADEERRIQVISRYGRILQAVWALSGELTVCQTTSPKPSPPGQSPLPPRLEETAARQVRMLILRENLHRPNTAQPARVHAEYSHRFIVRGFWRNQQYGPHHSLRRRQWIPPYVKGPSDKPLICKDTVRVWRR